MNGLLSILLFLRSRGLRGALAIAPYTFLRNRLDRLYARQQAALERLPLLAPGRLLDGRATGRGQEFQFENAGLSVEWLAHDLVRLSWTPGEEPLPYAIAKADWPPVEFAAEQISDGWLAKSSQLQVVVWSDGKVDFRDPEGRLLKADLSPFHQGERWTHRSPLVPGERLYGLGEQAGGLNLRGRSFSLWNSDPGGSYGPGKQPLYMPLPVIVGLHHTGSYLAFFENASRGEISLDGPGSPGLAELHFSSGMLRQYFIPGPLPRLLERFSELTGRAPLPPRWALGYHQSRWGYRSAGDIRAVAAGFRERSLPVSAIHLDIDYMDGFRVFTVDRSRFPDLPGLAQEMGAEGIRLVTILDPGVKEDLNYDVFQEGITQGRFCTLPDGQPLVGQVWPGRSLFPDFTDPAVRQWWGEYYPRLLESGIAGFWHDMNEPSSFTISSDQTLPLVTRHALEGRGGDHTVGHNLYALLMNRAGWEALRRLLPERRPWIISRAGWVSQQRYAWNWTGDTESSWAALRMTVATVIGKGLSGLPFTGPDIGGFSGQPSAELYLRSFQMAAFLPFFRTHSALGTPPREPWVYGEPTTRIIAEFLRLRYRLLPYLYTLAWQAAQTGAPLVRPLFWSTPDRPELWEVDDAFALGDALLVAPVVEEGATHRSLLLPPGGWYNFWEDRFYPEPGTMELSVPQERIPVFVRAGTVLPMDEGEVLHLNLYPPIEGNAESVLYSDAGEGYGPHRLDRFTLRREPGLLRLSWHFEGDYPFQYASVALHLHGQTARQALVDGAAADLDQPVLPFKEALFHLEE